MSGESRGGTEMPVLMFWTAIGVVIALVGAFVLGLCSVMAEMTE